MIRPTIGFKTRLSTLIELEFFQDLYSLVYFLYKDELKRIASSAEKIDVPCVAMEDNTLQSQKVCRQVYHGKRFVGDHMHRMLKVNKPIM